VKRLASIPLALFALALSPTTGFAQTPMASSSFAGAEDPLSENGAWAPLTSLSPNGGRFQKNNGAFPDRITPDHAGARTTVALPADHYSEIVVGQLGATTSNVGPTVRVQTSGASVDSHYLWWASLPNGLNNLYRIDANGTSYTADPLIPTSPVTQGDRLRLIARGPVIYGIKNGVRDFIYNTGPDATAYAGGTSGILAATAETTFEDATITSWSAGAAPSSSGTHDSSIFVGAEDPLDEGDRWYPLPGYAGFKKTGGLAMGKELGHNATAAWSIAPPATQYSEVTLGTVASGGGGPLVRVDRNASGQTGWMLFLFAENPTDGSGIYKLNPDGSFTLVRPFVPLVVSGDKWRLTANGNTLEVFRNGVSQFTYTTDGSYPSGDVGMEALTPAFTFVAWEGGELSVPAAPPDTQAPTAPSNLTAIATGGGQVNLMWMAASDDVGVTGYLVERCQGAGCSSFAQVASVNGTSFNDTALLPSTSYSYRVRATDAAGNFGPYSNVASATTLPF
jgi:Fibronectin type III domain